MKIFITGGYGFIGSNFILEQINYTNNSILNYDKITYAGNPKNLKSIKQSKRYTFVNGDICDSKKVEKNIFKFNPDAIIHFAAESHVDRSIEDPSSFINTNIIGTAIMLKEAAKYFKCNKSFKFLHVSTDEVFGSLGKVGYFSEDTPYNPSSPYSASKASSDHLVAAWTKTYNFPSIITNCSNNYGPYQFPEKLVPLIISNCIDGKSLPIYGDGQNVRDWLYVKDHCKALYQILKKGKIGDRYNIGGNNDITNIEIVKTICSKMDKIKPLPAKKKYSQLISYVKDRAGHDFRYAIDSSKLKNDLGWEPLENFKSGIDKTINWYIDNEDWWRKLKI